jgi:hypothetical protein
MGPGLVARAAQQIDAIKAIQATSGQMATWVLSVLGGSIVAIVSTSCIRPTNGSVRFLYLLYLPGWLFLGISIFDSNIISRYVISGLIQGPASENFLGVTEGLNATFLSQQNTLSAGLAFLSPGSFCICCGGVSAPDRW